MGVKVEMQGVSYSYESRGKPALRNISLKMEPGKCYAVLGPNASGKTTLLKIASLLYKPEQGVVLYDGVDPWRTDTALHRRRAVYVHEKPVMLKGTVRDNIALGLKLRGVSEKEADERIKAITGILGLSSLLEKNAAGLSAGQKQLVAIARAIVVDPDFLALDEAFANLDASRRMILADLIVELKNRGKTIALATHDIGVALSICDSAFYLEEGELKLEGSVDELLEKLYTPVKKGLASTLHSRVQH
ncbi:MAG: ABC transporter ATP-binding protein [Desulfurococcus sp.]|nr:ABC transporter ATP-binding protein [Desulfurococcus sp.]